MSLLSCKTSQFGKPGSLRVTAPALPKEIVSRIDSMGLVIRFLRRRLRELTFGALAAYGLGVGGAAAFAGFPHLVAAVTPGLSAHAEAPAPELRPASVRLA